MADQGASRRSQRNASGLGIFEADAEKPVPRPVSQVSQPPEVVHESFDEDDLPELPARYKSMKGLTPSEIDFLRCQELERRRYGSLVMDSDGPDYHPDHCMKDLGKGYKTITSDPVVMRAHAQELQSQMRTTQRAIRRERQAEKKKQIEDSRKITQQIEDERIAEEEARRQAIIAHRQELDRQLAIRRRT